MSLRSLYRQFFPPSAPLTEETLPDQSGKVFIVTGGYSGIGLRLAGILYRKNATVYLAGRSEGKALEAIKELEGSASAPKKGKLVYMPLRLDDLAGIRKDVEWFLERETRLDVLWNNAGLRGGPVTETKQGHEIHIGTNCLGPFLFTQLLHPILSSTAAADSSSSVRVIWLSSIVVHLSAPKGGGMDLAKLDLAQGEQGEGFSEKYVASKTGSLFIAAEWARRDADAGIVHLSLNPGNLKSPLQRHMGFLERTLSAPVLYDALYGAHTELFAGLSPTITRADSGRYILPWGRLGAMRADIEAEMGAGPDKKSFLFFEYCMDKTREWR